jgi:hypothetical protein
MRRPVSLKKSGKRLPRGKRSKVAPGLPQIEADLFLDLSGAEGAYPDHRLPSRKTQVIPPEIKGVDLSLIRVPKGRRLKVKK